MPKKKGWMWQILVIENKGFKAFQDGVPYESNPYCEGHRNQNGPGGNLQKQRGAAWYRGWRAAQFKAGEKE